MKSDFFLKLFISKKCSLSSIQLKAAQRLWTATKAAERNGNGNGVLFIYGRRYM